MVGPGRGTTRALSRGVVDYARRNHMVPIPHFASRDDFNADLEGQCRARLTRILRGHKEPIGERLQRDLPAMRPLPCPPSEDAEAAHILAASGGMVERHIKAAKFPAT